MSFNFDTSVDRQWMETSMSTMMDDLSVHQQPRWKRRQLRQLNNNNNNSLSQEQQQQHQQQAPLCNSTNTAFHYSNNNSIHNNSNSPSTPTKSNSSSSYTTGSKTPSDRFIASRKNQDMDLSRYRLFNNENDSELSANTTSLQQQDENSLTSYSRTLEERMFDGQRVSGHKILAMSEKAPAAPKGWHNNLRVVYSQNRVGGAGLSGQSGAGGSSLKRNQVRHIPTTSDKVLDAPALIDDYYLNLLDWSSQNVLAIALSNTVYLWNADSGNITPLMQAEGPDNYVTSLSWLDDGSYLALGTNYCDVQIWDIERAKRVRTMKAHSGRVGSLSWNNHILSSGGRDGLIFNHDVRKQQHIVARLIGHDQEVCGLKWSPDGTQLASGGNDNVLNIWDAAIHGNGNSEQSRFRLTEHCAAVKALAWCPWQQGLLASGGGTADRRINFWNTSTGAVVNSIDTRSQVCSIIWSKNDRELVSSHGFSMNQLTVWKYPSLVKIAECTGHSSRVLHMAQSPDGSTIVSAAGDETLRFWKIFSTPSEAVSKANASKNHSALSMRSMNIR